MHLTGTPMTNINQALKFHRAILIHPKVIMLGKISEDASFSTRYKLSKISQHYIASFMNNFRYISIYNQRDKYEGSFFKYCKIRKEKIGQLADLTQETTL